MAGAPNEDATIRWIRIGLLLLATTGGGFGAAQGVDLFGAKQWQEENVEKLLEAERAADRLLQCRAKVDAYERQNEMLIQLVDRMQTSKEATPHPRGRAPGPLPELPRLE